MKHTYKSGSLLMLAMVIVGLLYQFSNHPWKPAKNPEKAAGRTAEPDIPQNTVSQLQKGLEKREYHISYDKQKQSLQSPNRKQNLRAYYKPGKLSIQNRVDSAGQNFKLHLTTAGVYANKQKLYAPEQNAELSNHENQLEIYSRGITEQYINSEEGVRQNFIIENAPDGTESLEVRLVADGLKVSDQQNNELHFYSENKDGKKTTRLIYNDLKCWDSHGKPLDATLAYQNERIIIEVNVASAVFPVTIDPIISSGNPGNASTTLESNQVGANSGRSVSSAGDVNGDGYSDVIIGAPLYDKGETNEGAVFVHYGSASGISVNPAMILEGNQAEAQFGGKAALAGDVNKDGYGDIIVGASLYDKGQTNEGAAFIYHGSANGLSANPAAILESNQAEARFGVSVNVAGDVNADGYSDVVVGAILYDNGQTNEGAAFVYHGSAAGINTNAAATLESNQAEARMGNAVSSAGDVNGDGYSDIIAGVYLYDKGELDEGAAFVYLGSALGISVNVATILESNQTATNFGAAASFAGDVNGDGYGDVVVGAYLYDNGQTDEGAAFVYLGSAAGIIVNSKKLLEINQNKAQFGYVVSSAGDVNGDGYADIIVGADRYDKGETDEGAAFIYHGAANGILANAASTLESNQIDARMGCAVASAGDVNGDGYSDVVVGAYMFDKGQVDEGAGFVWMGSPTVIDMVTSASLDAGQAGSNMGYSVAGAGDVNGDGYDDVVVGAYQFDNGQLNEGAAFIFHGSKEGISIIPAKIIEGNQSNAELGISVSSAGDVNADGYSDIIIGAWKCDMGQIDEGAAFIYHGSAMGIGASPAFMIENNQASAYTGWSVSDAGDVNADGYDDVIVGAYSFTKLEYKEGAAFVYYGSSSGISNADKNVIVSNQPNAYLGWSVSGAGDVNGDGYADIVIGAITYGSDGAAFVYYGSSLGINLNTSIILENNGQMGNSVSEAGDVNGDGFADIVIGAPFHTENLAVAGAAFVYYGSNAGINLDQYTVVSGDQEYSESGLSVGCVGDVDGDGYSDIIVGAPYHYRQLVLSGVGTKQKNGKAFIYNGSNSGIKLNPYSSLEVADNEARLGTSVGGAGDVNGDGYSDVIVGAPNFGNGNAFVAYGNTGYNLKNNLRLYNSDLATPINHNQFAQNNFGAGLYTKSFLGGNKGKLIWETKPKGQGFSKGADNVITHSTQSSGAQNVYASLGLSGVELKNVIAKQGTATKVRARVKYDPVLALTGQTYGPWRYLPSYLSGGGVAPVPDSAFSEMSETGNKKNSNNLNVIVYPNPVVEKLFVQVGEAATVANIQLYSTAGRLLKNGKVGERELNVKDLETGTYILLINQSDGTQISRKVLIRK